MTDYERNMSLADQFTTDALNSMRQCDWKRAEVSALCAQAHATMALAASNMESK